MYNRGVIFEMEFKNPKKSLRELWPLKKMITQLLISVSIFSLVFSCSSLLHHHLRNLAVNKKYIFLICNGILIFLTTTSAPPSASGPYNLLHKRTGEGLQVDTLSDKHITSDESHMSTEDDEALEMDENGGTEERSVDHSNERSDEVLISIRDSSDEREDAENELQNLCLLEYVQDRDREESSKEEEEEEEELDEIEKLRTEELNLKFEDFIRRMKEEFRVNQNQQQQLVLVK